MSEDVNPTPEGANPTPEANAKADGLPEELQWVATATPAEIARAIKTLQEKSSTRLDDLQARDAELARLRAEKQQAEDAKLAEQQKWQELAEKRLQELAEKEAALNAAAIDRLVIEQAATLKFHSWQEAKKLADLSGVDTSTTDGGVSAVKNALEALAKNSPHLIQSESSTQPQTQPGAGVMNPAGKVGRTRADIAKMSAQEIIEAGFEDILKSYADASDR